MLREKVRFKKPKIRNLVKIERKKQNNDYLLTSIEIKDNKEYSECTFVPRVNKSFDHKNNHSENIHDKLYEENQSRNDRRERREINMSKKESLNCTFRPNTSRGGLRAKSFNFEKNNSKFLEKKKTNLLRLMLKKQKELDKEHSFIPKINLNSADNSPKNKPRFIKLNENHILKEQRLNAKRVKYFNENNKSHMSPIPRAKSSNFLTFSLTDGDKYYEKLFLDAKKMKNRKMNLSEKLFKKDHTFSPKINNNVEIKSSFKERNENIIKIKQELLNKIEEKKEKLHTKEEIDINNKNIVERLYIKEIEKIREKRGEDPELLKKLKKRHKIKFKEDIRLSKTSKTNFQNFEMNVKANSLDRNIPITINPPSDTNSELSVFRNQNKTEVFINSISNEEHSSRLPTPNSTILNSTTPSKLNPQKEIEKNFRSQALLTLLNKKNT